MENLLVATVSYDREGEISPHLRHILADNHHMFCMLFEVAHSKTAIDRRNYTAHSRRNELKTSRVVSVAVLCNDECARCRKICKEIRFDLQHLEQHHMDRRFLNLTYSN
jgi:hypothetical protein